MFKINEHSFFSEELFRGFFAIIHVVAIELSEEDCEELGQEIAYKILSCNGREISNLEKQIFILKKEKNVEFLNHNTFILKGEFPKYINVTKNDISHTFFED